MTDSASSLGRRVGRGALLLALFVAGRAARAADLTAAFEVPPGFHIHKVAGADLSGGSYDLTFDGQGRLLVGDTTAVRRLSDRDGDGVFDGYDIIATGLGPRGPQGLLVDGDRLFAVGGDGVQLFEGYSKGGPLVHRGRVGAPFNTGWDHCAHSLLRGHDGYIYLVTGDGGRRGNESHITEVTSPSLSERNGSVYRFDPTGRHWECVARGGRNPPNLGQNHLGDLFSLDSDMEWHVGQPWYRPVRLHHWLIGGDQGWMAMDALPPYAIDALPGIYTVGRGSPGWGVFYEHEQLPARYRNAYLVADYPWKHVNRGGYPTSGPPRVRSGARLLAFFIQREGAAWSASMEVVVRPRPGAQDDKGQPIQFALLDVEVGPDGSLYVSDHNQGIWRITYDGPQAPPAAPVLMPRSTALASLLALPQPASEVTQQEARALRARRGDARLAADLRSATLDRGRPLEERLRALRWLAPGFAGLPAAFIDTLARDPAADLRGQAAWLRGLRGRAGEAHGLLVALDDGDAFVRRRAAEALTRVPSPAPGTAAALVERLGDPVRLVGYAAMMALAHRPAGEWFEAASAKPSPAVRMRALVAAVERKEEPQPAIVRRIIGGLLSDVLSAPAGPQAQLDLLRLLAVFQRQVEEDFALRDLVSTAVLGAFPSDDRDVRHEQTRVLGLYRMPFAFDPLVRELRREPDFVAQFHVARALGRIAPAPGSRQVAALVDWMVGAQTGWFAKLDDKGGEFPYHWLTTLSDLGRQNRTALLARMKQIDPGTPLGAVALDLLRDSADGEPALLALYASAGSDAVRINVLAALRKRPTAALERLVRAEEPRAATAELKDALLLAAAALPPAPANVPLLRSGLESNDLGVARAAAAALGKIPAPADEALAGQLVWWVARDKGRLGIFDRALSAMSGATGPDRGKGPEATAQREAVAFWSRWYAQKFGKPFVAPVTEKPDDQIHAYILGADLLSGNARQGQAVYDRLQCAGCHGGPGTSGTGPTLAPDLTGVVRRLSRAELADAVVYPSKQVAERFRVVLVETTEGESYSGFVTGQDDEGVVMVDRTGLHRIPRKSIRTLAPQTTSLMPDRLLGALGEDELQNLLVYLATGEALPRGGAAGAGPLFDGKSLAGWEGDAKLWRVEGGKITGGSLSEKVPHNVFLATKKSFQDFELRLKIKITGTEGKINGGVQIRSVRVPGSPEMRGYQVDAGPDWWGKLYDESRRNKVLAGPAAAVEAAVKPNDWNEYRIRCEGPRIRTWFNGVAAFDYTEADAAIPQSGQIGIQVHGGGKALVEVKDVVLDELAKPGRPKAR